MGSHAAPRPTAPRRGGARKAAPARRPGSPLRKMLLGSLALLAATALATGGRGTYAYWTDTAPVTTGTLTSGRLDLTVDGAQSVTGKTGLALSAMVPGESVAANLQLANAGNADFTWTPTVATGATGIGPVLQVQLYVGGTESGDDTTYPRTEGCTGGTLVASGAQAPSPIRIGAAQTVCVKVTLPTSTPDAYQGQTSGSATITIAAAQVLNP